MKGTKTQEILKFSYRNTGEAIEFPVGTIHGAEDGPTLVVIGGMHGSEFCGIQGAISLFQALDPKKVKGTVIIATIYNMPAFKNHMGFVVPQDGKNSMRTFPGTPNGTYSEAMAFYFWENVLKKADFCIELHGGDIPESLAPFIYCPETGDEKVDAVTKKLSEIYDISYIVHGPANRAEGPGSAFGKLALSGVPAILTEAGQQGILDDENTEIHHRGLTNVMIALGMLDQKPVSTVERKHMKFHGAIRNKTQGMWHPAVKLHQAVKEGELVGQIRDYFGNPLEDIKAPITGTVTVVRTSPSVGIENVLIELHHLL